MNNDTLMEILKEQSMSFTGDELQSMLDEELEKGEEEMDTDLVDACLDALDELDAQAQKANTAKKRRGIRLSRALLIAAVLILAFSIAIPVCAKYLHIEGAEKVVQFCNDHFAIDLSSEDEAKTETVNVVSALKENGMERVYLPSALFDENSTAEIENVSDESDFTKYVYFYMEKDNIECQLTVGTFYDNDTTTFGEVVSPKNYENAKQLKIEDIDIVVLNKNSNSYVYYIYNEYECLISLKNCNYEKTIEIANTIKEV